MDDADSPPASSPSSDPSPGRSIEHDVTVVATGPSSVGSVGTSGPIPSAPSGQLPSSIGRYRILGKLGEGGMGIVYEAEQQDPRRRVALKVIRGGRFVDESVIRMFRREAETLARLRHANIGAIYESGHTDDGQHYFAMELVLGQTLDAYLARRGPAATQDEVRFRLAMFRRIADAVHYAHQRGVIHRDLKPTNIIVSEEAGSETSVRTIAGVRLPELKILDFGLARITEGDVHATQVTEIGILKGTLPYMSPEQARGQTEAIDVRTDVYALGVILYEMLAGSRPYDVGRGSLIEAVRVICEESPRSLRTSMGGRRSLDPDIETVVGKALEKDSDRRYASAAAMSEDIERYLASQPILARPPSTMYQIRKFAGRNRALVAGVAATFIVLVAGVVVSSMQAVRAIRAEALARQRMVRAESAEAQALEERRVADGARVQSEQARQEAETQRGAAERERGIAAEQRQEAVANSERAHLEASKAGAINRFLQDMLATADPWAGDAGKVTLDAALVQAQRRIGSWAATDPDVNGAIRGTLASAFTGVGRFGEAESLLRGGLDASTPASAEMASSLHRQLGMLMNQTARYEPAESEFRSALSALSASGAPAGDTAALVLSQLAAALAHQGRYAEADSVALQAAQRSNAARSGPHLSAPEVLRTRAYIEASGRENYAIADSLLASAISQLSVRDDDRNVEAADAMEERASNRVRMGDLAGADSLYRAAVEWRRRMLGDDHPLVARALETQSGFLLSTGRVDQTIGALERVLAIRQRGAGPESAPVGRTWATLAPVYARAHRVRDAEAAFRNGVRILRARLGARHPDLAPVLKDFAEFRFAQRNVSDAVALAREALSIRLESLGGNQTGNISYQLALATALAANKTIACYREAETLLMSVRATGIAARGEADASVIRATRALVQLYTAWGNRTEARRWQQALAAVSGGSANVSTR